MVLTARLDRGLTQREMAARCGVSLTTIQRLETGGAAIPRTAKLVADFLGCSVTDLPFYEVPGLDSRPDTEAAA